MKKWRIGGLVDGSRDGVGAWKIGADAYIGVVPRIRVLSGTLASQVAAGEVVERPASVIKELVENSLDAGAGELRVEIRRGGAALMRVVDDGSGMSRDDALLSLERHATSKLAKAEDLAAIRTLGFRGEAVPSIASVSRFRLTTREGGALAGTELQVEGGELREVREAGCAEGTAIEVRDLFFNLPARRKFLRTEATESAHVEHQLRLHALAAPGVRFRYRKDEREVFDLPGGMSRLDRVRWMLGTALGGELVTMAEVDQDGCRVAGFVLPARHARKGRRHQCVFLNGRPVDDAAISRGLAEGFRGELADGLHPAVWLWLDLDPALVDVNVHPAKREIRLHRPHALREAVARAVSEGLAAARAAQRVSARAAPATDGSTAAVDPGLRAAMQAAVEAAADRHLGPDAARESPGASSAWRSRDEASAAELALGGDAVEEGSASPSFRPIGELCGRFALLESEDGLVLLDPRAARERILYERWIGGGGEARPVESQSLLVPALIEAGPRERDLLLGHRELLREAGFEVEEFGRGTLRVGALPAFLHGADPTRLLLELADELADGARPAAGFAGESLARSLARRAAQLEDPRPAEARQLLDQLFRCELPYCTADGRPTLIELSLAELERRFHPGKGS